MPAVTPSFLFDFESRMQAITEREYARLTKALWWQRIAKVRTTGARRDVIAWLLSTAMIKDQGEGGNKRFDDLVSTFTEIEMKEAGAGLKLRRYQLEDTDGNGLELAAQWSSDIGAYMAYWPQKQVVDLLRNGHTASLYTGYDGLAFFATNHPYNPFRTGLGTYKNLFTGGDAAPIHDSGAGAVSAEIALANLGKVFGLIKSIKMPNGEDPRFLKPVGLIVPPQMFPRAVQLTNAKFLAQAASSGGGSGDVEALIAALGFSMPIEADELSGYESDTTYFVAVEQLSESPLGAVIYTEREPFKINYYTGTGGGTGVDAILNRAKELEWHADGRNSTNPGHPYLLFKVKAT